MNMLANMRNKQREEMPTLDPKNRTNFLEVELGYENKEVALHETSRCHGMWLYRLFYLRSKKTQLLNMVLNNKNMLANSKNIK